MNGQGPTEIPSEKLTLEIIPQPDADRCEIDRFALTLNGYEAAGSFAACAEIAQVKRKKTLTELRITLFFNQRARRHVDLDDLDSDIILAEDRELIRQIREKVAAGGARESDRRHDASGTQWDTERKG